MVKCWKCGKEFDIDGAVFCPFCGSNLAGKPKKRAVTKRGNQQGNVYRRGNTWTARVTVGKKLGQDGATFVPVRKTKGGFRTRTEAINAISGLMQAGPSVRNTETFEQIYLKWKEEYQKRVGKTTISIYVSAYKHFKPLHFKRFTDIVASDMQACIDDCSAGGRTRSAMRTFVQLLYKYAINNNVTDRNIAQYLYIGDYKVKEHEAFTMEEIKKIRDSFSTEQYAPYVYVMCYLGFRPGEMLKLKKSAYHAEGHYLIGGGKTKAGTDRMVPVPKKIQPIIDAQLKNENTDYLFPKIESGSPKWKQMDQQYFRQHVFFPMMERLGITGKVPYSCRHTYANLLKDVRGADKDKAALMGHADYDMTKYYQSTDLDHLRKIVDQLGDDE